MASPGPMAVRLPSPLVEIHDERLTAAGITLLLKRDDLIHPDLPGNKWRKLRDNLTAAREGGYERLLTFGGAYSNHIRATAAAGNLLGFETVGIIRGEPHDPLNWSLSYAVQHGMRLSYLERETYRRKSSPAVLAELRKQFGEFYLLPEGGSNDTAVRGCAELPGEIDVAFDVLCCPVGTGGTLAGIAAGLAPHQRAIGFSALKGGDFLIDEVIRQQHEAFGECLGRWRVETRYHCGGFAKRSPELDRFLIDFAARHQIRLDWVYVGKMMLGIFDLAARGEFRSGTRIVAVVTGPAE